MCNAHHLRELERPHEQDNQQWAKDLQALLQAILEEVKAQGGSLSAEQARHYAEYYRNLLKQAESDCPPPDEARKPGQRGLTSVEFFTPHAQPQQLKVPD